MARPTFEVWMAAVDRAVERRVGLSVHDLADYPFRDAYDDGVPAARVARDVINEAI